MFIISNQKKLSYLAALLGCLAILMPTTCLAQSRRITCPNGHVQYIPCLGAALISNKSPKFDYRKSKSSTSQDSFAKIDRERFIRLSAAQGIWEGFVSGVGTIKLQLLIIKNGAVIAARDIGSVTQTINEKPTKFRFKSMLPKHNNWSWDIVATLI